MERIGTILRRLMLDPVNLREAAARKSAAEIDGSPARGGARAEPPTLCVDAPTPSGLNEDGRACGDKPDRSGSDYRSLMTTAPRTMRRDRGVAAMPQGQGRAPRPAALLSLRMELPPDAHVSASRP
jgi:hypothetical protein